MFRKFLTVLSVFILGQLSACSVISTDSSKSNHINENKILIFRPVVEVDKTNKLQAADYEVRKIASQLIETLDQTNIVAEKYNSYSVRLERIVKDHLKEDGLNLDYKVYIAPEKNAFSLANGSIRIYSGLMDLLNDAELLSVIGHEIGHVKLGHGKIELLRAQLANTELENAMRTNYKEFEINLDNFKAQKESKSRYAQDNEIAADNYGLEFLKRHAYDQNAAVSALKKIDNAIVVENFFETSKHPTPKSRASRIEMILMHK